MSFSYTGDPTTSALDQVRFLIGDTNASAALMEDEEIAYLVAQNPNPLYAAADAADQMAQRIGLMGQSKTVGDLTIVYSRKEVYLTLGRSLRARATRLGAQPYAGGQSLAEKDTLAADTSSEQPAFRRDTGEVAGTAWRRNPRVNWWP